MRLFGFPRIYLVLVLAPLFGLIACSDPFPGYGIITWSADEAKIATGSQVAALAHSELRKTVQVMKLDEHQKAIGDPISVENWRVREFSDYHGMKVWLDQNKDNLNLFARSLKLALPVRSDPAIRDGNITYRLREGEDVKVLSHDTKESNQGGLKGYWYEILTQTGTRGWVFSVQIQTWRLGDAAASSALAVDQQLDRLYAGNWRPEEFPGMIAGGNYDLGYFKPETGLVIDRTKKIIHLATDKDLMDYTYRSIDKVAKNIWNVSGTTIQITFRDDTTLVVQYMKGNNALTRVFIDMAENINELYKAEISRRSAILAKLAGAAGTITSGSYGSITIQNNGRFTWEGAEGLRPRIIPESAKSNGDITFDLFLAPELRDTYRGVASFNFESTKGVDQINFLFQFQNDGVQLEFIPKSLIKGREVKKADSNPTVLFFGY